MLDQGKTNTEPIQDRGGQHPIPELGPRAKRQETEQSLRENEKRLRTQNQVLVELTRACSLDCHDLAAGLRKITEAATQTLNIERVGVWLYNDDHSKIQCVDLYERNANRHSDGAELTATTYPSYFEALLDERMIAAHDARTDPRTKEYLASYLLPLGITSMLDAPIRLGGRIIGVICHEHVGRARQWTLDEQNFAASMADILSRVMEECKRRDAEKDLEKSISLLRATFESTADGILVVDRAGKMVSFNHKFTEMWRLPESITARREDSQALAFAMDQLKNPEGFLAKVRELYSQPDAESYDVLEFKDERVFERYSQPQRIGGKSVGRVWSFRDVTERKRTEAALRKSERKYRTLVEASPDVIMNIDRQGTILFINHTLPQFTVEGVIGTNVIEYIPADQAASYKQLIQKLFDTGERQSIVLDAVANTRWQSQLIPILQDGKVETALVIATDITERHRAAMELEKSVSLLRATLESTADGILVADLKGKMVSYNGKFVEMWGLPDSIIEARDDIKARAFAMDRLTDPKGFIERVMELYSHPDAEGCDLLELKDGRVIERYSQPQRIGGKNVGRVWSFRDITERKRAEEALKKALDGLEMRVVERTAELSEANRILQEQIVERQRAEEALQVALKKLQQLSHHILQIQENEYKLISRELHDNIAQSINAVKMELERLDRDATLGPGELRKEIRGVVTHLKGVSQAVRKLSKQMRPEILDELGLTATLGSYIKDFQRLTGIHTEFIDDTTDKPLPPNLETHLYRIVQEALSNIAQHARATRAVIRLEENDDELFLSIMDDGVGFSRDQSVVKGRGIQGIGLISIQERTTLLNGSIEISAGHGIGTQISVRVPIAE
jgi:PAS domain S-box-containing protein